MFLWVGLYFFLLFQCRFLGKLQWVFDCSSCLCCLCYQLCPYSSTRGYGKVRDFFPPACLPVPATRTGRFAIYESPGSRKAASQQLDVQDGTSFGWIGGVRQISNTFFCLKLQMTLFLDFSKLLLTKGGKKKKGMKKASLRVRYAQIRFRNLNHLQAVYFSSEFLAPTTFCARTLGWIRIFFYISHVYSRRL